MRRIKASIMALIIAVVTLFHVHKPADHEKVSESPTESKAPVVPPIVDKAPEPTIVAEDTPQDNAESTQVKPELSSNEVYSVVATHYSADCLGCSGITASGADVRESIYYNGWRIIAADKSVPLYTKVKITYPTGETFNAIVLDRGSAIKGDRIDVLTNSQNDARKQGKVRVLMEILEE